MKGLESTCSEALAEHLNIISNQVLLKMFCYEIIDEPSLSFRATPQLTTPTSQLVRPVAQFVQVLNATWTSRSQI